MDAGSFAVAILMDSNSLVIIPDLSTTYPMKRKRGTAIKTWFSITEWVFLTTKSKILFAKIPASATFDGSR